MGNNCAQTCQFKAKSVRSEQFLRALHAMEEWEQDKVPMPIPPLSQYAEDLDPSQMIQLDSSHPFKQSVETAKIPSNHLPEDLERGDFVRDNDGHTILVPSKGYIAYLKEYQWFKWVSESSNYDEAENS